MDMRWKRNSMGWLEKVENGRPERLYESEHLYYIPCKETWAKLQYHKTFLRSKGFFLFCCSLQTHVLLWFNLVQRCLHIQGRSLIQDRMLISFLTNNRMFKTKLEDEIFRLKELCSHMYIIAEKIRRRPLFLLCGISMWTIKQDESPLIRTLTALSHFSLRIEALIGALLIQTHSKEGPYSKGGAYWKGVLNRIITVCHVGRFKNFSVPRALSVVKVFVR